jgi:hypothetical protein
MATVKCNVKSKSVRENYTGKNNHGVTGSPTNCRTASLATAGRPLELRPTTMAFAATFTSPSSRRAAKSRRLYLRPAELLSSATESPRDAAKILAAIVEMAKADTDRFGCSGGHVQLLAAGSKTLSRPRILALRLVSTVAVFPFVNYDFRLDARKSCLTSDIPPVNGSATRFFRNALRRSSFASIMSTSPCFAATTAPIYFTKLIPHFSHFTPVRCLLPQDGHSTRIVM